MYPVENPEISGNKRDANALVSDVSALVSCLLCRVERQSASHLMTHLAANHEPCLCCVFCKALLSRWEFDAHVEFENEHPIRCRLCKAPMRSADDLEAHIDIKHGKLACSLCGMPSRDGEELKLHVELIHECPQCGIHLWNSRAVEVHLADVHGLKYVSDSIVFDSIEIPETRLAYLPGRLPADPSTNPEERCLWLYPFCVGLLAAKKMADYLADPPAEFRDRLPYVLKHAARVNKAKNMKRFKRLKGLPAKAASLARVLALPEYSTSYADKLLAKLTPDTLGASGKK